MRKMLLGLAAVAALAIATPASAKPWGGKHHGWHGGGHHGWHGGGHHWRGHRFHGGPRFGVVFGAPAYAAYGYGCPVVKKVRIKPNGVRVVRWTRDCW